MSPIRDGQSADYRKARDELLEAERELMEQRERVAELRRGLPGGTLLDRDYTFLEGPLDLNRNSETDYFETNLSDLLADGRNELIVGSGRHLTVLGVGEEPAPLDDALQ